MAIDDTLIKTSTSKSKNMTDIRSFLDSFNKEIAESEFTQVTTSMYSFFLIVVFIFILIYTMNTDDNSVENACFNDQCAQYYQIITEDGQVLLVASELIKSFKFNDIF